MQLCRSVRITRLLSAPLFLRIVDWSFAHLVNSLYACLELAIFLELSSEIFYALSHNSKAIKLN